MNKGRWLLLFAAKASVFVVPAFAAVPRSSPPLIPGSGAAEIPPILLENGQRFSAQSVRGKFLVVNFWASWCVPCRKELPSLERLAVRRSDLIIVAASVDANREDAVAAFAGRYPHLRLGFASLRSVTEYGALGMPYSVVFGRSGQEVARLPRALDWERVAIDRLGRPGTRSKLR